MDAHPSAKESPPVRDPLSATIQHAAWKALGGGLSGAAAMVIQVVLLMPLRTAMNYQYRYGATSTAAFKTLWAGGGLRRFYRGMGPALIQAPLSRFGDTAANAGVLSLLGGLAATADLPLAAKTLAASATAAAFRVAILPLDTLKIMLQVEGRGGLDALRAKVAAHGARTLYHGALASGAASLAAHFPFFAIYNTLQEIVPARDTALGRTARISGIGFCASLASDVASNSLRAVKAFKQTHAGAPTYPVVVREMMAAGGLRSLLFRGLRTRIAANALQGALFIVTWRFLEDKWNAAAA